MSQIKNLTLNNPSTAPRGRMQREGGGGTKLQYEEAQ